MEIIENELSNFLEDTKWQELATWQRQRSSDELGGFVTRRLALLEDVDESDFELAA